MTHAPRFGLTPDDIKQSIFGLSDGLTSALGVVIPLALTHHSMFLPIIGLAICASIGMGGGEFLSDKSGSLRSALSMAVASFIGTVLPALPFFMFGYYAALIVLVVLCAASVIVISEARAHSQHGPHWRAYAQTAGILLVASAATLVFASISD